MLQEFSDMVKPAKYHRTLVGVELTIAREKLDLTQEAFAELCGWSAPQQSRLENGENEIRINVTDKIIKVLAEYTKNRNWHTSFISL